VKKSEWSDKQLEELLRQMPKKEEHRNPRDIYQNLSIKKRRYPTWLLPGIATAAALLLFLILIPNLMVGTEYSRDNAMEEKSSEEQQMNMAEDNSSLLMKKQEASQNDLLTGGGIKTALYADEIGAGKALTYWIPDAQGQILIPVSTIVNIEENKTWLTLFNESMWRLKEEEWGLSDFYPLNATIELNTNDNSVIVDVPVDHKYGQGSAIETTFVKVIEKDIASNSDVKKVWLSTNGQPGIELGNFGVLNELDIKITNKYAYFFYYPEGEEIPFITPSLTIYKDINEALNAMRENQAELGLKASLPPSIVFKDVLIENNKLILTIDETSDLKDDLKTLYSFEALLLTAKEFGVETLRIENAPIEQLGPFDLTGEIEVPIAANFRSIQ
jgi:hypothetical protein